MRGSISPRVPLEGLGFRAWGLGLGFRANPEPYSMTSFVGEGLWGGRGSSIIELQIRSMLVEPEAPNPEPYHYDFEIRVWAGVSGEGGLLAEILGGLISLPVGAPRPHVARDFRVRGLGFRVWGLGFRVHPQTQNPKPSTRHQGPRSAFWDTATETSHSRPHGIHMPKARTLYIFPKPQILHKPKP